MSKVFDVVLFDEMDKESWYTITGAGGDLNEWVEGYERMLEEQEIGKPVRWVKFSGSQMNEFYKLTGTNAYNDDLTFLAFPLDGLKIHKLAIFKLNMEDRWFDDIVSNNKRREEEKGCLV